MGTLDQTDPARRDCHGPSVYPNRPVQAKCLSAPAEPGFAMCEGRAGEGGYEITPARSDLCPALALALGALALHMVPASRL